MSGYYAERRPRGRRRFGARVGDLCPASGGEYVWTVAGDSVVRRAVRLGELFGTDRVVVDSGLVAGERVVSAGVYRLQDGERVRILK